MLADPADAVPFALGTVVVKALPVSKKSYTFPAPFQRFNAPSLELKPIQPSTPLLFSNLMSDGPSVVLLSIRGQAEEDTYLYRP